MQKDVERVAYYSTSECPICLETFQRGGSAAPLSYVSRESGEKRLFPCLLCSAVGFVFVHFMYGLALYGGVLVLYSTVLCGAVLYCTEVHSTVPYGTILCSIALRGT